MPSDDLSDLDAIVETKYAAKRLPKDPGWKPGVNTERGEAVMGGPDAADPTAADWSDLLERYGLDPDAFTVIEPVEVRAWDAAVGDGRVETMRYFKAKIIRRSEADDLTGFATHLRGRTRGWVKRPRPSRSKTQPPATYGLAVSDPQIGKEDTAVTAERIASVIDQVPDDIAMLRDQGHRLDDFVIGWMGDGCEGVRGFYSYQPTAVVGSIRKQLLAAQEVAFDVLDTVVDHFPNGRGRMVFCASNHGELRFDGGALTNPRTDNLDLLVGDMLELHLRGNRRFANVDLINPGPDDDGNLAIAVNCHGSIVGFTHGHQFERGGGGGPATQRAWKWAQGQIAGRRNIESVDLMLVGHYHHDTYVQKGDRYIQICPPLDVGSVYFEESTGETSVPGIIRFVAREGLRYPEARRVLYPKT